MLSLVSTTSGKQPFLTGFKCSPVEMKKVIHTYFQNDIFWNWYIDGLGQNCSNSRVLAMELLQSYTKPSIWHASYWNMCLIYYSIYIQNVR